MCASIEGFLRIPWQQVALLVYGYWKTSSKSYTLEFYFTEDAGEDSDQLEDEDKYDRKDLFRISILEKNKIAVVILKDDSRHVLERD